MEVRHDRIGTTMKRLPILFFALTIVLLVATSIVSSIADIHSIIDWEAKPGIIAPAPGPIVTSDLVLVMKISVSVVVLACASFVILSKRYGPKDKHWAYATVGTLVGYWLNA